MIVDIGGGTTEVAVISLGGIVCVSSVRVGGDKIDASITAYIKEKHDLAVGEQTAEEIKKTIGSALPVQDEEEYSIKGRDLLTGLPRNLTLKTNEVTESMADNLRSIVQTVKTVLRETPPELSADVMDKGMILSGGGALLSNIDTLLTEATGVPAYIADDCLLCVAKGTGVALENLEVYKRSIMSKK